MESLDEGRVHGVEPLTVALALLDETPCHNTSPAFTADGALVSVSSPSAVPYVYTVHMTDELAFSSIIVNPEWMPTWAVIEVPGSKEFLGTGNSIRVKGTVDGAPIPAALMPSGQGYHFISLSKAFRKQLGKDVGDAVEVSITR